MRSVDVAGSKVVPAGRRLAPKLSLSELRQPFLDRIEQAIYKDPF